MKNDPKYTVAYNHQKIERIIYNFPLIFRKKEIVRYLFESFRYLKEHDLLPQESKMLLDSSVLNCRVIVIGDTRVGKTSLMNRLVFDTFDEDQAITVGASHQMLLKDVDGQKLQVQIWDTAGQERFKSLGPIYFRKSAGCIAVYDQTNSDSFTNLEEWIKSFTEVAGSNTVIGIAANKADLEEEKEVSFVEAQRWADHNNYLIEETSAKEGSGINELFQKLCQKLIIRQQNLRESDYPQRALNVKDIKEPEKSCC